jgi:hypothetical protein
LAEVHKTQNLQVPGEETTIVRFEDDSGRVAAFEAWCKRREAWCQAELPARQALEEFNRLYSLHVLLAREAERFDLVLGDGILSWQLKDGAIYHPLALQRVQLVFDSKIPEFSIIDADVPSELQTGLFQSTPEIDPVVLRDGRSEFEVANYHPLDQELSGFLQGFVNRLSAQELFTRRTDPNMQQPALPLAELRSYSFVRVHEVSGLPLIMS